MDLERHDVGLGKNPAIIIVDMVNGFTDPECPLGSACPDVVAANLLLLDAFRAAGLPIFFTTVIYRTAEQAKVFRQRVPALNVLEPDSHWVQVDSSLGRQDHEEIIEKRWASAFFGTDLAQKLQHLKVDSLVVTGLTTSGCVRASVLDGLQHDYPVVVPREAVGDRNLEAHAANLHDMNVKYADVVSTKDVVDHLSSLRA
ncbi:MAG: maleamate amidohydrolase [Gammaproteobacteria bacterium]|jgi:maleamate amidohydrolase